MVHEGNVTEEFVTKFGVVVLTDNKSREDMVRLSEAAHRAGRTVIASDSWGVFGYVFVDCGDQHEVSALFTQYCCLHTLASFQVMDRTGERPFTGYLASFYRDQVTHLDCVLPRKRISKRIS